MIRTGVLSTASNQLKKRAEKARMVKCRVCKTLFQKKSMAHVACSPECALSIVRAKKEKSERKEIKERKEKLKTRSDWIREAQVAFNSYVRLRDQLNGFPCVSSGKPLKWEGVGGGVDAGHYRSRGSAPHLRFHLWNCHAQSKQENRWASGNAIDYRINLIKRIGLEKVEALEADNTPRHWDIEYLKRIKAIFTKKARRLEKRLGIR